MNLDFATKTEVNRFLGNLLYIIMVLLVDRCFWDGNKRTAAYMPVKFLEENKIKVNQERLVNVISDISRSNPKDLKKIKSTIKYTIK